MIIVSKECIDEYLKKLEKRYNINIFQNPKIKKGKVIIGPPAIGKSYFVNNQFQYSEKKTTETTENSKNTINISELWIDMDSIFSFIGLDWHKNESDPVQFEKNYRIADFLIEQCSKLGLNLIGCIYYDFIPDAFVKINTELHIEYLKKRSDMNSRMDIVNGVIKDIDVKSCKHNVKIYSSIKEAVKNI